MSLPVMTVAQVARELKVSESRVRQLLAAGELPRPHRPGQRMLLWMRADIRAYLARQTNSGSAAMFSRAERPLLLASDMVLHLRQRSWAQAYAFHVRVYVGPDRRVVLLSEPTETSPRLLRNWATEIATDVAARALAGLEIGNAVWIDIAPPESDFGEDPSDAGRVANIHNIIMERTGRDTWGYPSRVGMTVQDLDDLLGGAPVDWFDWPHYNEQLVAEWGRTAQPVDTIHDPLDLKPWVDAVSQTEGRDSTQPWADDARTAMLLRIRIALDSEGFVSASRPIHPAVNTSRRIPYQVPQGTTEQASTVQFPDWEEAVAAYRRLLDAALCVDEFSGRDDEVSRQQDQVLQTALAAQRDVLRVTDFKRAFELFNAPSATLEVNVEMTDGPWDSRYLRAARWFPDVNPFADTVRGISHRSARVLLNQLGAGVGGSPYPDQQLTFGLDPRGVPLLRRTWTGSRGQLITDLAVLWPSATQLQLKGLRVVGDGARGDRPVYLADNRDEIVALLPRSTRYNGWNFGYGGGGPGQLEADISRLLASSGKILDDAEQRRLSAGVEADQDHLDIPLSRFLV